MRILFYLHVVLGTGSVYVGRQIKHIMQQLHRHTMVPDEPHALHGDREGGVWQCHPARREMGSEGQSRLLESPLPTYT